MLRRAVPTVDELLRNPLTRGLTLVAGPWDARPAGSVVIVDAPGELARAREGAVALLTPHASSVTLGYQLDVALRMAGEQRLAAVAVYGTAITSVTAIRLADRTRVALLTIDSDVDLTDLAFGLARLIRADPGGVLNRTLDALRGIAAAEAHGSDAVLAAAATAVGSPVTVSARPEGGMSVVIVSDGHRDGFVCAEAGDHAARLAAHLAAGAIGRVRTAAIKAARRPAQARADAIAAVLAAAPSELAAAAERARDVGVRIDDELAVVRLEVALPEEPDLGERRAAEERLEDVALAAAEQSAEAAETVAAAGQSSAAARDPSSAAAAWYRSSTGGALLLVHAGEPAALPLEPVLAAIRAAFPAATTYCGVGSHLPGPAGLRESAAQAATAAAAARGRERPGMPVHIDAVGMPPMLVDWLGSGGAQVSMQRALAALAALPPARAETAVRTLQAYLDERGSLQRAGERLHLHRNAVAYRMRRIREALGDVDLDDADRRLELQLACRAFFLRGERT
jgi:PucR C-terminal helix-turn-helix domain